MAANDPNSLEMERLLRQSIRNVQDKLKTYGVMDRVQNSASYLNEAIRNAYGDLKGKSERTDQKMSAEGVFAETQSSIQNDPVRYSPGAVAQYDEDLQDVDIHDLIQVLFSPEGEPMDREQTAERIAEMDADPQQSGITHFLREQRLAEQSGIAHEDGTLLKRVSDWRNSDIGNMAIDKKGVLKTSQYAMMAGIIVGTGGAAIPGMVASKAVKKMQLGSHIARAGQGVYNGVTKWMTDHNVISESRMDKINNSLNEKTEKLTNSRMGKFASLVGTVALCGGAAYLAGEASGFDRVADAWSDAMGPSGDALDNGVDSAKDVAQGVDPDVDTGDTPAAGDDELDNAEAAEQDVATYQVPDTFTDNEAALVHPHGGIARDELIAQIEASGGLLGTGEQMANVLSQMPEQITADGVRDSIESLGVPTGGYSDGEIVSLASKTLGISDEALTAAVSNPAVVTPEAMEMVQEIADGVPDDMSLDAADIEMPDAEAVANDAAAEAPGTANSAPSAFDNNVYSALDTSGVEAPEPESAADVSKSTPGAFDETYSALDPSGADASPDGPATADATPETVADAPSDHAPESAQPDVATVDPVTIPDDPASATPQSGGGAPPETEYTSVEPGDPQQFASTDPVTMSAQTVDVDIQEGDTLSDIIVEACEKNGVDVSAQDLYKEGGLVDQVAQANGFDDPDMIFEGGTVSMTVPVEGANLDPEAVYAAETIGENAPQPDAAGPDLNGAQLAANEAGTTPSEFTDAATKSAEQVAGQDVGVGGQNGLGEDAIASAEQVAGGAPDMEVDIDEDAILAATDVGESQWPPEPDIVENGMVSESIDFGSDVAGFQTEEELTSAAIAAAENVDKGPAVTDVAREAAEQVNEGNDPTGGPEKYAHAGPGPGSAPGM